MNPQEYSSPYDTLVEVISDPCRHRHMGSTRTGEAMCTECGTEFPRLDFLEAMRDERLAQKVEELEFIAEARETVRLRANPPQPIGFLSGSEMGEPEPMVSLVGDILYKGDAGFLVAPMATGKTYLALWLAHALLTGEHDFIGYPVMKQERPVFFLQQDQGRDSFIARTVKLGLYDRPDFKFAVRPSRTYDASVAEHSRYLAEELVAANAGVLIVDAWSDVISENESDNTMAAAAFGSLKGLRETANLDAVVILAHPGKDVSRGMRAASSVPAAADFMWTYEGEGTAHRTFKNTKPRHSNVSSCTVKWDPETGRLSKVEAPTHMPETQDEPNNGDLRRKGMAIMLQNPDISVRDFRDKLGGRASAAGKVYHEIKRMWGAE